MNKATKNDLEDMSAILEALVKRLPKLSLEDQVDVCARIRAVSKHANIIDAFVKDVIKRQTKGKPGTVPGDVWKANVSLVPTRRLDQTMLKVEYPEIHAECTKVTEDLRILFEPR